jgi:hypothetical protein
MIIIVLISILNMKTTFDQVAGGGGGGGGGSGGGSPGEYNYYHTNLHISGNKHINLCKKHTG